MRPRATPAPAGPARGLCLEIARETLDLSDDSLPAAHGTPDDFRMLARTEQLELLLRDGSVPGGRAHDGVEITVPFLERVEEIDIKGIDGAQMDRSGP